MSEILLEKERGAVVEYGRALIGRGLTRGTGGNISVLNRGKKLFAISPSGLDYFRTRPEDVAVMDLDGKIIDGTRRPSSELALHRLVYREREDAAAIVHTHSVFATAAACTREIQEKGLPPVHYLLAFAGQSVRCIPYAPFGTEELARLACEGLRDRCAVLLGNHGLLAIGPDIDRAFNTAEELEFVCEVYCRAKAMGTPALLSDGDMDEAVRKIRNYGRA